MNNLLRVTFLISISIISTIYSQNAGPIAIDEKGLGASSCIYFGGVDSLCGLEAVGLCDLPKSCTSFIFDYMRINCSHNAFILFPEDEIYLNMLSQFGSNLFVNIGHENFTEWTYVLDSDGSNAIIESKNIHDFTRNYPGITGLIFRNWHPDPGTKEFVGLNQNLLRYIETVKNETGFVIGLNLDAELFLDYYDNPTRVPWLDFSILDSCVELYTFTLLGYHNICSDRFRTGVIPINGNAKYTLEKLESALLTSKIPKKKTFFQMVLYPVSRSIAESFVCKTNYQNLCLSAKDAKYWCADTQETFFKKGQWAQQHGSGFIGAYIDLDDPQNYCKCGPFPGFNAILAGFNGSAAVPACSLFDRPA